ncbi:MAG: hypothetical protein KGQ67_05205 [Betaproteobacteria bacterium]|nr:hypothetical protein [Betaproteobacteria bacterium]
MAPLADAGDGRNGLRQSALWAWLSLLAGSGTLVCCALPALLVMLGAGAALSGLVAAVPQIVWLSEHKGWVFGTASVLMLGGGVLQWRNRTAPCPLDPDLRSACLRTRRWSQVVYGVSLLLLAIGAAFAFVLPALMSSAAG